MHKCPKCGSLMIKVRFYDPEGTVPLEIVWDEDGEGWACINGVCEKDVR